MSTYQYWLTQAKQRLSQQFANDPTINPNVDAALLLNSITGKSHAWLYAYGDTLLNESDLVQLENALSRRLTGEPMAYILGEVGFWDLILSVSRDTLIPRPDTEILVEKALELIEVRINSTEFLDEISILDLGTGTGAIALALASALTQRHIPYRILAVDFIEGAVKLAEQNRQKNQISNVVIQQSNWFENVTSRFDFIVSNPPYIDEHDHHLTQGDVRFEPLSALTAKENGYADLWHIIKNAPHFLLPNGCLLLEHGWQQGEKVRLFFAENQWESIETVKDYGGNERVTLAYRKEK